MGFLQFPPTLTEEEQMLQAKFAKLRKKKKQVLVSKQGKAAGPGGVAGKGEGVAGGSVGSMGGDHLKKDHAKAPVGPGGSSGGPGVSASQRLKMSEAEAKEAKEKAKKLLQSGAIAALPKGDAARDRERAARGFKRSQGLERKLTAGGAGGASAGATAMDVARATYQPFSATHGPSGGFDTGGEDMNPDPPEPPPKKVKNLYDSFVSARDREERGLSRGGGAGEAGRSDKPRAGNTVYVFGYSITEDLLKSAFAANGKIVNVSMEVEKNCGFVTFDKAESAEQAISEHNGSVVQGIQLKVSMARRQPVIEPINDASSSATWSTIAASHSQKGSHKDKRDLVAYDEDMF